MTDTRKIVEAANLGIVELVWLSVAMQAFLPNNWQPLISVETVYYIEWSAMEVALGRWEEGETNPNHLDVIHKVRAAAESLEGGTL